MVLGELEFVRPSSLSARRAWIEIVTAADKAARQRRRSPQGERG